jgi:hypothetical protein
VGIGIIPGAGNGATGGITVVGNFVAIAGLITPGTVKTGAVAIVGTGAIAGEGETVGTDDVGIVRVQADSEIALIPTSNLKYFTLKSGVRGNRGDVKLINN